MTFWRTAQAGAEERTEDKSAVSGGRVMLHRRIDAVRKRLSIRLVLKLAIILLALTLAFFSLPSAIVERFYSNGIYPKIQWLLTRLSNRAPFAVNDVLIIAAILGLPVWWTLRIRKARRGRRRHALGLLFLHTLVLVASTFLIFEMLWGLNYVRKPLAVKLEYDRGRVTADALRQLTRLTVEKLNAESPQAHDGGWPGDEDLYRQLKPSFDAAVLELGNASSIVPAVPKASLFNSYLSATGIEGFINPFTLEVVLDTELLPVEKPFALAHEWAHLAGFADESEANFVALLTCIRSDSAAVRYAGWLALFQYLPRVPREAAGRDGEQDQAARSLNLSPEVLADLRAISERASRSLNAHLSRAQSLLYDNFLKANRVKAGIGSYGLLVRLVLGTRFSDWMPSQ